MRKAVRRGKLRVVREGGERLSLGGEKLIVSDHGSDRGWVPEFLFKYTDDAGVAGLREGFVRLGSALEYRQSENQEIRDANEHSVFSQIAPVTDPRSGESILLQVSLQIPGAIFCASQSDSLRGAFPGYNRRVVIRVKPFLSSLGNAIFEPRHFVQFDKNKKAIPLQHLVLSDGILTPEPSSNYMVNTFMEYGNVWYTDDLLSDAHPLELQQAIRMGEHFPMFEAARFFAGKVLPHFRKHTRFQHEKEYRVALSFARHGTMRKIKDGEYMSHHYFTDSLFVKIDNPGNVFIFSD